MEILPSEYQSIELSRYEKMFVRHAISNDGYGFLLLNVNPSMLENESMNVVITSRGVVFFKFFTRARYYLYVLNTKCKAAIGD